LDEAAALLATARGHVAALGPNNSLDDGSSVGNKLDPPSKPGTVHTPSEAIQIQSDLMRMRYEDPDGRNAFIKAYKQTLVTGRRTMGITR
jgi:hypothetical protein